MKKIMILATALLVLAVSCSKNEEPQVETKGVPMSLKVSFDDATKISYAKNGSVLKATWDASETISVVTLDGINGKVVAIDNFTSVGAEGREKAIFTGTFTGGADPARVVVIYPAIEGGASAPYVKYNGSTDNLFYGVSADDAFVSTTIEPLRQTADDNADHLENFCLLSGVANITDIKTGAITTTLSNQMTILKVVATFADADKGKTFSSLTINSFTNASLSEADKIFPSFGWSYIDFPNYGFSPSGSERHGFITLYGNFTIPATGVITLYVPVVNIGTIDNGARWQFSAQADSDVLGPVSKDFTKSFTFQRGYIYTINVSFI